MLLSILLVGTVVYLMWLWFNRDTRLQALPGPKGLPLLGVSLQMKPINKLHLILTDMCRQHGPVMYLPLLSPPTVVISGYEAIYDVTVKQGMAFGGRPVAFRGQQAFKRTGILTSTNPDRTWSSLRKTSHRHLKQFGDGLSHLESVIQEVGDDMFQDFTSHANTPYDPKQIMFDTTLNSIAFLITGERSRTGDQITNKMRDYETRLLKYISPFVPLNYLIIDFMPWLRYFNIEIWKKLMGLVQFENEIWSDIKAVNAANPDSESLCKVLMAACDDVTNSVNINTNKSHREAFTELDAQRTSMNLLFAGVTTTSNSFYAAINILAHHPDIQDTILDEIHTVCHDGLPTLPDRSKMPYSRAFLLELLRYSSVVPMCVPHRAIDDQSIHGYTIPQNTNVQINLWSLHHDPDFWTDPEIFRPERFLDSSGELVPADHPHRKHLMPFGAGSRVCLGESLASARLFLWITKVVSMFLIIPAKGNHSSATDPRNFHFDGVLRPTPYEVLFDPRLTSSAI